MNRTTLALPFLLAPGFAAADVAPADVWSNFQAAYAAMGLTTTGDATQSGDTLSVSGATVILTYPMIGGEMTMTLPDMNLVDLGDGTVSVELPETYLITTTADIPGEDEQISFDITISQKGVVFIASGTPGDVTYTTSVDDMDMLLAITDLMGEEFSMNMEYDGSSSSSVMRITEGDPLTISVDGTNAADSISYNFDAGFMQESGTYESNGASSTFQIVLPADMDIMNLTPALKAGLSISAEIESQATSSTSKTMFDGQANGEQIQNTGPSNYQFSLGADGLTLTAEAENFDAMVLQPELLPFPIEVSGTGVTANFAVPLVASETPQQAIYAVAINGLEVAEGLWGMIDPGQGLDRSPVNFEIDLRGDLMWDMDVFDVARWMELEQTGEVPIAPVSAQIETLTLNALGGSVAGTGAFSFDNTDMMTFPGMPRPEGSASFRAEGLNAVIDQLVATGLLPEDQAGMGRMFMGMFARATGDDTLESDVEINAQGHLMLNGQRMR